MLDLRAQLKLAIFPLLPPSCGIMFHNSTQKQHWMFRDDEELREIRKQTNLSFTERQEPGPPVLDPSEELELFRYYQKKLVELCHLFAPPKWIPLPRTALVRGKLREAHVVLLFMLLCPRQRQWPTSRDSTCAPQLWNTTLRICS